MALESFPEIDVPWDELEAAAGDLDRRAGVARGYLAETSTAWTRIRPAYEHAPTQSRVHTALDELAHPMETWSASLGRARSAIDDFVAAGRPLQRESEALAGERPGLAARAGRADEEPAVEQELSDFNIRALTLSKDWRTLVDETVAALDAIADGTGSGLPLGVTLGGPALPAVDWAGLTSTLDTRFGATTPGMLLVSLRGLDAGELRLWAAANPEAAALLAGNVPRGPFPTGSPEARMASAMADGAHLDREGIRDIRDTWLDLSAADQERLLLLYPGVFGNLNGVPFAQRVHANIVTAAGHRQDIAEDLAELGEEPRFADYLAAAGGTHRSDYQGAHHEWQQAHRAWTAEKARLEDLKRGLDYAVDHRTQVVLVTLEGDGRIVTMNGTPSATTDTAAVLVPGTGASMGDLETYMKRLDAVGGDPDPDGVSFYWQGTDLPDELHHNLTSSYNEDGGPLLAAFDHALDLEVPDEARSTYVGYSAGGSLLGTGEREGLDSTNIVYVAPAGTGHDVGGPGDTANPDANRYWIQTRDDPISAAQELGGGYHGGSFWSGGHPGRSMGAVRLETGFLDPQDPSSLMSGHSEYFRPGSTAAGNIRGVISNGNVSLHVPDEHHYGFGYSYIESPIESRPEDYSHGKLETVSTEELEK